MSSLTVPIPPDAEVRRVGPEPPFVAQAPNHRTILDRALFRRFDMVLDYEMPDTAQAAAVMRRRLGSLASRVPWTELAEDATGLSHADLVRAAESAAKSAILTGNARVGLDDLRAALRSRHSGSCGS